MKRRTGKLDVSNLVGLSSTFQAHILKPTRATTRKLGISTKPSISKFEWRKIERDSVTRCVNQSCPICFQTFSGGDLILDCGHIFHKTCLNNFEKFMKGSTKGGCPVCRTQNYKKKKTDVAGVLNKNRSAIIIQKSFRRWICQRKFKCRLDKYYMDGKGDSERRRMYFRSKLANLSGEVTDSVQRQSDSLDMLLRDLDRSVLVARKQMDDALEMRSSVVDWDEVRGRAENRLDTECAICLGSFAQGQLVLLSCSHMLHSQCLQSFEDFSDNKICPCCRKANYQKKELEDTVPKRRKRKQQSKPFKRSSRSWKR
eukprot:TRINITY_DN774023_c0_g1_i1.p1 TRINITY_DN774023_c0_g1~~TRINITY_DN774023_c0_g1_i1.p1  ORF type:complete len:313 (+),score=53.66 TRINITY_DN774023_c0_g1_i1:193-1131(+)